MLNKNIYQKTITVDDYWNAITAEDRKKLANDFFACGLLAHIVSDGPSRELVR